MIKKILSSTLWVTQWVVLWSIAILIFDIRVGNACNPKIFDSFRCSSFHGYAHQEVEEYWEPIDLKRELVTGGHVVYIIKDPNNPRDPNLVIDLKNPANFTSRYLAQERPFSEVKVEIPPNMGFDPVHLAKCRGDQLEIGYQDFVQLETGVTRRRWNAIYRYTYLPQFNRLMGTNLNAGFTQDKMSMRCMPVSEQYGDPRPDESSPRERQSRLDLSAIPVLSDDLSCSVEASTAMNSSLSPASLSACAVPKPHKLSEGAQKRKAARRKTEPCPSIACTLKFETPTQAENHFQKQHVLPAFWKFPCSICSKKFPSQILLSRHSRQGHESVTTRDYSAQRVISVEEQAEIWSEFTEMMDRNFPQTPNLSASEML